MRFDHKPQDAEMLYYYGTGANINSSKQTERQRVFRCLISVPILFQAV